MNGFSVWAARFRSFFVRDRNTRLEEELELHAEMLVAEYMRRGIPEPDARAAALRELGNRTTIRERYHEQSGVPWLEILFYDLRYALRVLRRDLAFSTSCLTTLAIGSAGLITTLCVAAAFLWTPLPYPQQDRLAVVKQVDPRGGLWPFSEPAFLDLAKRSRAIESLSASRNATLALTGVGEPEAIRSAEVTPSFFCIFGIHPLIGRVFQKEADAVVISPALWTRKWRRDPALIGHALMLEGKSYIVAGVADMPRDLLPGVDLLLPLAPSAAASRSAHEMEAFAKLRPGISVPQAQADLSGLGAQLARQHAGSDAGWSIKAVPLSNYVIGDATVRTLWMILAGVALLWILTCANVAGLQLARRISRLPEMATRVALGASRMRLLAQALTESAVLASLGVLFGLAIADWIVHLLRSFSSDQFPRLSSLHLDMGFTVLIACGLVTSMLLFGIMPSRRAPVPTQRGTTATDNGRDFLVIGQVAMACVLTLVAGLLVQSFFNLRTVNPGFSPDRLLTATLAPSSHGDTYWQRVALVRDITARIAQVPGIEAVGATNVAPFSGSGTVNRFRLEADALSNEFRSASWRAVTPGYFRVTNLPLKTGRLFTEADTNGSPEVLIVSESMARELWPNRDPVGQRILWGSSRSPKTVIGVIGDMRDLTVGTAPVPTMFRPFAQLSDAPMTALIRVRENSLALLDGIRNAMWSIDPGVPVQLRPLRNTMSGSLLPQRSALQLMAAFALIALTIAVSGLYGLISYRVNQRRREMGIRLALGASPGSIRWHIQLRCLILVCSGLCLGIPVAFVSSRFISSLLYEVGPGNLRSYICVVLLFMVVAFIASFPPANNAARLQPASVIRQD